MDRVEQRNAIIESTMLGVEDHGLFTFFLTLDYGGSGQGAGGYILDTAPEKREIGFKRYGTAIGMSLIMRVLDTVGVHTWEALPGQHLRVRSDSGRVHAIAHILKDNWLDFDDFFRTEREREAAQHGDASGQVE